MTTIPEQMIMSHLDALMTGSKPGADLHELHVVAAPRDAIGPLGLPDENRLEFSAYVIAVDGGPGEAQRLVGEAVSLAARQAARERVVPLFAALAQEAWWVDVPPGDVDSDELAARLSREGRLFEHPDAIEATIVYAAGRDGRRWRGRHRLTGPNAGTSADVETLVGHPCPHEGFGMQGAALVRKLVGMHA